MKRRIISALTCIVISAGVNAQVTIKSGSTVHATGIISTKASLNNSSDQTNFQNTQLILTGVNQTLSTASALSIKSIDITGGGTKTLQGEWTVTQDLIFTQGILNPGTGKIIYTGSTTLTGNASSFVNGVLFQRGTGTRFFPIGVGTAYAPMAFSSITNGSSDVGVKVFASGASLDLPQDLSAIATNRYWEVTTGAYGSSLVSLYSPGSSIDGSQRLTVVEADSPSGATAINLGGGVTGDFISSFNPATKPILTLGISESVNLRINDLITPFNLDDINDKLKIINIQYTFENTVTLLDRWGVVVRQWKNFSNYDDPNNPNTDNFDFANLSPGNYICVLEYKLTADSPKEKLTQMISVLKGN